MKKILKIFVLSLIAVFSFSLFTACEKQSEIKLTGFDDIEVESSLYEDFSVAGYVIVLDENGNEYEGTVSVKDYEGNDVELSLYRFELNSLNPYTVTVTVKVSENDIRTRKITVKVKDTSTPRFTYSFSLYTGTAGTKYDLPTVSAKKSSDEVLTPVVEVYYVPASGSPVKQELTNNGFTPQNVGLYEMRVSVTDKYGKKTEDLKVFSIRPQMASNMLEDFAVAESAYNVSANTCDNIKKGEFLSEFEGASGVVHLLTSRSMNCMSLRFNKPKAELSAMDIDCITVRLYLDYESDTGVKEHWLQIGAKGEVIKTKEWVNFTVTKAQLIANQQGSTAAEKWQNFAEIFNSSGTGNYFFGFKDGANDMSIYIDGITFGKISIEEYVAPTTAGGEFVLPSAKLVGAGNAVLSDDYTVSVKNGTVDVYVFENDGEYSIKTYSGTTTVEYAFFYEGIPYSGSFSFDIGERAINGANVLEDFGDAKSNKNASADGAITDTGSFSKWYEHKEDKNGTTAFGVVEIPVWYSMNVGTVRFNKTEADLIEIMKNLEYVTVKLMVHRDNETEYAVKVAGVANTVKVDEWSTVLVSKNDLLNMSKITGANEQEKIASFASIMCSSGVGTYLISVVCDGVVTPVFLDDISLGLPEKEENEIENFTYSLSQAYVHDNTAKWLASYTDKNGVTEYGIGYGSVYRSMQVIAVTTGLTASELEEVLDGATKINVRILATRPDNLSVTMQQIKIFGNVKEINVNEWTTISLTISEAVSNCTGNTEAEKISAFVNNLSKTGEGRSPWTFGAATEGVFDVPLYIDSITVEKA